MAIKNIIFDFGGVLVDWNPRYLLKDYFSDVNEMESFVKNVCSEEWNAKIDGGYPFHDSIVDLQGQFPQYHDILQAAEEKFDVMLGGDFPKTVELLYKLKSGGYKLYGLTNWSAQTFPIAYNMFPFFKEFDGIVISGVEKMTKPNPQFYYLLLNRYNIKAEESIFIDDRKVNVEAALSVGIHGVLFDDPDDIEQKVMRLIK